MDGSYYARQTLHSFLSTFLEAHGLNPRPMPSRRPPPAPSLEKQLERVALSGWAIAEIGQQMSVGPADRHMIALFVDAACDERDRNAPRPSRRTRDALRRAVFSQPDGQERGFKHEHRTQ